MPACWTRVGRTLPWVAWGGPTLQCRIEHLGNTLGTMGAVVYPAHRYRLRAIPVGGGEGQGGRAHSGCSRITGRDLGAHTGRWPTVQHHRVAIGVWRPRRQGAAARLGDGNSRHVVIIYHHDGHMGGDHGDEGAKGGSGAVADAHPAVAALVHVVVHTTHRHRLGTVPVRGSEGQGGAAHCGCHRITGTDLDGHTGRWPTIQHHPVAIGAPSIMDVPPSDSAMMTPGMLSSSTTVMAMSRVGPNGYAT